MKSKLGFFIFILKTSAICLLHQSFSTPQYIKRIALLYDRVYGLFRPTKSCEDE